MGVIRIPPQDSAHGEAHRQTSGFKISTGETNHTLERYGSNRPARLIDLDKKIQTTGGFCKTTRLTFNEPIPGISLEHNSALAHLRLCSEPSSGMKRESRLERAVRRLLLFKGYFPAPEAIACISQRRLLRGTRWLPQSSSRSYNTYQGMK